MPSVMWHFKGDFNWGRNTRMQVHVIVFGKKCCRGSETGKESDNMPLCVSVLLLHMSSKYTRVDTDMW